MSRDRRPPQTRREQLEGWLVTLVLAAVVVVVVLALIRLGA